VPKVKPSGARPKPAPKPLAGAGSLAELTDGAFQTDASGNIIWLSPAALFGLDTRAMSGVPMGQIVSGLNGDLSVPFTAKQLLTGRIVKQDGTTATLLLSLTPRRDAAGRYLGAEGIVLEIPAAMATIPANQLLPHPPVPNGKPLDMGFSHAQAAEPLPPMDEAAFTLMVEFRLSRLPPSRQVGSLILFALLPEPGGAAAQLGDAMLALTELLRASVRPQDPIAVLSTLTAAVWLEGAEVDVATARAGQVQRLMPALLSDAMAGIPLIGRTRIGYTIVTLDAGMSVRDMLNSAKAAMALTPRAPLPLPETAASEARH
jgi:hypothetical protein